MKLKVLIMAVQSQLTGAGASTITFPNVARALIERVKWFEKERATIQHFAQASIKAHCVPDLEIKKHCEQIERTRAYLDLLGPVYDMPCSKLVVERRVGKALT